MDFAQQPLENADNELLDAARRVISANYEHGRFHVGAAVRMGDGRVFTGVHVEANVGRVTLCAEAVAIGAALSSGARDVQAVVAVAHPHPRDEPRSPWVVSPCGMCRELISDFGPEAWVIIPTDRGAPVKVRVLDLLPAKYRSNRGSQPSTAQ